MTNIARFFQTKYHLTDYQTRQLAFLLLTFSSELSKLLLLGVLFHSDLKQYLFATAILLLLRTTSGGLHFKTYWGCFLTSACYYFLALKILPKISVSASVQMLLLLLCLCIICRIGAVTSSKRPVPSEQVLARSRRRSLLILFPYLLATYIIPENRYLYVGFWVIILHTLQLLCAHFLEKGGFIKHGK